MSPQKNKQGLALIDEAAKPFLDSDAGPEGWKRSAQKVQREQENRVNKQGFGETPPALAIAEKWLPRLTAGFQEALAKDTRSQTLPQFMALIRELDPEVLALCVIQTALNNLTHRDDIDNKRRRDVAVAIGIAIAGECWAHGSRRISPAL